MGVGLSVVVVEDHDGGDHGAGHHEHDAVEVGPWEHSFYHHVRLKLNKLYQESSQMKERKLDGHTHRATANVSF